MRHSLPVSSGSFVGPAEKEHNSTPSSPGCSWRTLKISCAGCVGDIAAAASRPSSLDPEVATKLVLSGRVRAQYKCDVSTRCHPTDGLSTVSCVAVHLGSRLASIQWSYHEKHTRVRLQYLHFMHHPRFTLRRMFMKCRPSFSCFQYAFTQARTRGSASNFRHPLLPLSEHVEQRKLACVMHSGDSITNRGFSSSCMRANSCTSSSWRGTPRSVQSSPSKTLAESSSCCSTTCRDLGCKLQQRHKRHTPRTCQHIRILVTLSRHRCSRARRSTFA